MKSSIRTIHLFLNLKKKQLMKPYLIKRNKVRHQRGQSAYVKKEPNGLKFRPCFGLKMLNGCTAQQYNIVV